MTTGDFRGNATSDLVIGTADGHIELLRGDGTGGYQVESTSDPLPNPAHQIVVGSFHEDVDSFTDVAAIDRFGHVYVLFGNNQGGFLSNTPTLVATIPLQGSAVSFVAGKFFGDTHEDLAALDNTGQISIIQSQGKGAFASSITIPGQVRSYQPPRYDPSETYTSYATSLVAGSFQTGETSLAVVYHASYEATPSRGTVADWIDLYLSPDTAQPISAYVPSEDKSDLVVATAAKLVSPSQNHDDIAVVDGQGKLLILTYDGANSLTYNDPKVAFGTRITANQRSNPIALTSGDFDGDGVNDLACLSEPGRIDLLLGSGNGGFVNSASFKISGADAKLALSVSDTTGSGRPDLIVAGEAKITTFLASENVAKIISVVAPPTYEGDPNDFSIAGYVTPFDFIFSLDSTPIRGSFDYKTRDGSAKSGKDYRAASATASFALSGSNSFTITIMVKPNDLIDPLRQFSLDLSNAKGLDLNGMTEASQTIIDDDSEIVNTADQFAPLDLTTQPYVPNQPPIVTLRKAILVANAMNSAYHNPAGEAITFHIPFSDTAPKKIRPFPELPIITGKTHINGFSQPGTSASSLLAVGNLGYAPENFALGDGFVFGQFNYGEDTGSWTTSAGSVIEGLEIGGFQWAGIVVDNGRLIPPGTAVDYGNPNTFVTIRDVTVTDCGSEGIGIRSGAAAVINNTVTLNGIDGIKLLAPNPYVSGNTVADNAHNGILIGSGASGALILNNDINRNVFNGIQTFGSYGKISENTLDGNLLDGIFANTLGTSISGGAVTNSGLGGIETTGSHVPVQPIDFTTIKDVRSIDGNDIGIRIESTPGVTIRGNGISNNRSIGISLVKTTRTSILNYVSGSPVGVRISASSDTVIGNPSLDSGADSIEATDVGIWIEAGSTGNLVQGSRVHGGNDGIRIASSSENLIGNSLPFWNNQINGTNGAGIAITGGSRDNVVLGSSIFDSFIGISLNHSSRNTIGKLSTSIPYQSQDFSNQILDSKQIGISLQNGLNGNFILGNQLGNNNIADIVISGSDDNQVFGETLGSLTPFFDFYPPSEQYGLILRGGAQGNLIGYADGAVGDGLACGNSFNGNNSGAQGILLIEGANRNRVFHNNIQNTTYGIRLVGAPGNQIGQSTSGANPGQVYGNTISGGQEYGLAATQGSNSNRIEGNLINGFAAGNVEIDASNANSLVGNWIGTDDTGRNGAAGNLGVGVLIRGESTDNRIGGATNAPGAGLGNVISGNASDGVLVTENAHGNLIAGNIIGLDATARAPVPNSNGIEFNGAPANQIGAAFSRQRNLIAGNRNRAIVTS